MVITEDLIISFFSDFKLAFSYLLIFFNDFVVKALSYPVTYYVVFFIILSPMLLFLLVWLQDFISDGMGVNIIGRHNPLPPNVYAKEKEGIRGFNRFIRSSRSKRIKEMGMKRGRIYKTKTLVYKGKKYRYVTSERAPEDFQGNFNIDE